jgi:uncharacterized glyoxalase superfamily protein PhnB
MWLMERSRDVRIAGVTVAPSRRLLSFYQSVFGGDLSLATYADIHSAESPEQADRIAFGRVKASNGFDIMLANVALDRALDDDGSVTSTSGGCSAGGHPFKSPACDNENGRPAQR